MISESCARSGSPEWKVALGYAGAAARGRHARQALGALLAGAVGRRRSVSSHFKVATDAALCRLSGLTFGSRFRFGVRNATFTLAAIAVRWGAMRCRHQPLIRFRNKSATNVGRCSDASFSALTHVFGSHPSRRLCRCRDALENTVRYLFKGYYSSC